MLRRQLRGAIRPPTVAKQCTPACYSTETLNSQTTLFSFILEDKEAEDDQAGAKTGA